MRTQMWLLCESPSLSTDWLIRKLCRANARLTFLSYGFSLEKSLHFSEPHIPHMLANWEQDFQDWGENKRKWQVWKLFRDQLSLGIHKRWWLWYFPLSSTRASHTPQGPWKQLSLAVNSHHSAINHPGSWRILCIEPWTYHSSLRLWIYFWLLGNTYLQPAFCFQPRPWFV